MTVERVRVGEVLRLKRREVTIDPVLEYRLIGVYSFGKGIFHREPRAGAELGDYRFFSIEPGDLVLSNIQAWEGAIAFARKSDTGTIGTHRFLSYVSIGGRIDTEWARWFFLSEPGMDLIRQAAPGTVMRNRTLAIERFEALEIPLLPVLTQKVVADRLNRVSGRVAELSSFCRASPGQVLALVLAWLESRLAGVAARATLGDVAAVQRGRGPRYEPGSGLVAINQACIRWGSIDLTQAREVERSWWIDSPDVSRVADGDVLVNSTGEGTIGRAAVAGSSESGIPFDSHVLAVRSTERLTSEFLVAYLRSPSGQAQLNLAKGANTTKQTELGKSKLEQFTIPFPTLDEQQAIVSQYRTLLDRATAIQEHVGSRGRILAAVLPAALNEAFAGLS